MLSHVAWRTSGPFQALRKIHQFDLMLDANVRYGDFDDIETVSAPGDPIIKRREIKPTLS